MTLDIEVISFDLDNTLYDYEHSFKIAINELFDFVIEKYPGLKKRELQSVYKELKLQAIEFGFRANKTSNEYRRERFRLLIENFNIKDEELLDALVNIYSMAFERDLKLYPDVKTVLDILYKKYKLGLISEGPADMQRNTLKILGLDEYFHFTFFSSEVGLIKSEGTLFNYALNQIVYAPNKLIHIGDSQLRDIKGAKKAGLKVVWLNRVQEHPLDGIPGPDFEISNLNELLEIL